MPVVSGDAPEIKLFGKWALEDVQLSDMSLSVSTTHVLAISECDPKLVQATFLSENYFH